MSQIKLGKQEESDDELIDVVNLDDDRGFPTDGNELGAVVKKKRTPMGAVPMEVDDRSD